MDKFEYFRLRKILFARIDAQIIIFVDKYNPYFGQYAIFVFERIESFFIFFNFLFIFFFFYIF